MRRTTGIEHDSAEHPRLQARGAGGTGVDDAAVSSGRLVHGDRCGHPLLRLPLYRMVPSVCGVHHDDGVYVLTAKALAAGEGYRLVQLPERPLQTKYPILYPAVLAVIWRAWPTFPDNLVAMQLLSCISMAAALGMSHLYSVRWGVLDRSAAAVAATVTATVPLLGYFATLPMSEGLFMLALIAAMWQTESLAATRGEGWRGRVVCGLTLTACALLRTAGLVIVMVMLIWLARRRALKASAVS